MTAVDFALRAEALFSSDLQRSEHPDAEAVRSAVDTALDRLGEKGCAECVAEEFGEHPENACRRMVWAREAAADAFALSPA